MAKAQELLFRNGYLYGPAWDEAEEPERLVIELFWGFEVKLLELQVWVRYLSGKDGEADLKMLKVKPKTEDSAEWKYRIAETIQPLLNEIEYYYVVAVVKKTDGSKGYRTIVPRTDVLV